MSRATYHFSPLLQIKLRRRFAFRNKNSPAVFFNGRGELSFGNLFYLRSVKRPVSDFIVFA